MQTPSVRQPVLRTYALLTYAALLVNVAGYARDVKSVGTITPLFVAASCAFYSAIYIAPIVLLMFAWRALVARSPASNGASLGWRAVPLYGGWLLLTSFMQLLLYADRFVFHLYNFHFNGFVWNLFTTRGGLDSMGAGSDTTASVAMIAGGFVLLQAVLLAIAIGVGRINAFLPRLLTVRKLALGAVLVILLGGFEQITYGISSIRGFTPVLVAADVIPLYMPITFNRLAKSLGVNVPRQSSIHANAEFSRLSYPRKPIHRDPPAKPLNIVWLVAESLRADMLDPKIMPRTWQFAEKSTRFTNHYSAGNGTRMAMFGMFYGLYGCYWFPFLAERRGPVLIDTLLDAHYQMQMFTSAEFTMPEFDKTIFARVPTDHLHEYEAEPRWRRDEANVGKIIEFIESRDPARPFMTFMFFESPHAKYFFPPETAIVKPYAQDINYTKLDKEVVEHIGLIKNRYINACHYLDSQLARVFDYLDQHKLLDSTIVIVTGDHGEEFMEKGRWGHNSTFSEEQTRPPLVIWVPGRKPAVITRLTSHLDLPATILPLLGVTNPPEDYSLGFDLFGDKTRDFTVLADWSNLAYVDASFKAVFPMRSYSMARQTITTRDDAEVTDTNAFYSANQPRIIQLMRSISAFGQ